MSKIYKQACGGFPGFYSEKIKKLMQELDENAMAIKDSLVDILMEERGVSEKSYEAIRMLDEEVSDYCDRIKDISKKMGNKRPSYCAEILYDELFAVQQEGEDPCGCTECKIRFDVIAKTDSNWYKVSQGKKMNTWYQNYKFSKALPRVDNQYPKRDQWYGSNVGVDKLNYHLSLEDVENIDKENQAKKKNGEDFSFLGSGTQGVAFTSGNMVKKYTTHESEEWSARKVMEKQQQIGGKLPYVVEVFGVNYINNKIHEIILEKVQVLNEMQSRIFRYSWDMISSSQNKLDDKKLAKIIHDMVELFYYNKNDVRDFITRIIKFKKSLLEYNIVERDIIPSNVGLRGQDIVVLDLGSIYIRD